MLDSARTQRERLIRLLDFSHEFVESSDRQQVVDAVVGFRFGRREAESFRTRLVHVPGAGTDTIDMNVLEPDCIVCNV